MPWLPRRALRAALVAGCASALAAAVALAQTPCASNPLVLARSVAAARVPRLTGSQKAVFDAVVAALRQGDTAGASRQFETLSRTYFSRGNAGSACELVHAAVRLGSVDSAPAVAAGLRSITAASEKLNTTGDDAQLANVDLQNVLQKQQQTIQMLSNISKLLYDTAMGVIRKIGG
jgi:hypothetical protein